MKTVVIVLIFISCSIKSICCSCVADSIPHQRIFEFMKTDRTVIFKGIVIYRGPDTTLGPDAPPFVMNVFSISGAWKGLDSTVTTLTFIQMGTSCDNYFMKDSTYLVYAYMDQEPGAKLPSYGTSLCTPTKLLTLAASDLQILGKPLKHEKPIEKKPAPSPGKRDLLLPIIIISLMLTLIPIIIFIRNKGNRET
jgi:hypothetical protein